MEIYSDDLQRENTNELSTNLIYIKSLDRGSFGKVILAKEKLSNKDIAVKIIEKRSAGQNLIDKLKEEIYILKKLSHENIVKFYGYIETSNQLLIKMEYLKYGTLNQWMKKHKTISEEDASIIIKKILSAIAYLHSKHICHRDIKPENIMLSEENNLNSIKIIDFGLSAQNFEYFYNFNYCGTFIYMAPEEIEKKSYNLSVDMWSIGILMYMLLNNGEHPFYHNWETKETFLNNLKTKNLKFNNKISYLAINLIKKLLENDPIKRYRANDALKHPWITRNPEDKIPQTFNYQLNNANIINKARELAFISIFLNHMKKNNIFSTKKQNIIKIQKETKEEEKKYKSIKKTIENVKRKKNKKYNIFKISKEYLKRCENIRKMVNAKEKCLDFISTVDETEENNFSSSNLFSFDNNKSNIKPKYNNYKRNLNNSYSIIKRKNEIKGISSISKEKKEKPIILFSYKKFTFKKISKKENAFFEEQKIDIKQKQSESIFITNLDNNNYGNNFLWSLRSTSKKENYRNEYIRLKGNNNSLNNINSFYKNLGLEPVNLFINNSNQLKEKKNINGKKISILPFEKNILNNKTIQTIKNYRNSLKLPKIKF